MSHRLKAGDTVWTAWCNDSKTTVASAVIESVIPASGDYALAPEQTGRLGRWLRRDLGSPTKAGALSALAQSLRQRAERFRGDAQQAVRDAEYEEARAAKVEALAQKGTREGEAMTTWSYEPTDCELGDCGPCESCREQEEDPRGDFVELGEELPGLRGAPVRVPAGTIDLTPSWESVALMCMDVLQDAGAGSVNRELARTQLLRAAKLADLYVKLQKERA